VVNWKAIPWEIRPVAGYDHVLFVRTASGEEACFGPVEIRGDIEFVPGGPVPSLTLAFQALGGKTTAGVFAEKRHFVALGDEVPTTEFGLALCKIGSRNRSDVGAPWLSAVTTDGEAVTCQLCVNELKRMAAAHKASKTHGDFVEIPEGEKA
jgi:hypothetical protein